MRRLPYKFKGSIKKNLQRISQKIQGESYSPLNISDMIRGEIVVDNLQGIKEAYMHLNELPQELFNVIKITNQLGAGVCRLVLNFIW